MRIIADSKFTYIELNCVGIPIIRWECESCGQKGVYKIEFDYSSDEQDEVVYRIMQHYLRTAGFFVTKEHIICSGCLNILAKTGIAKVFLGMFYATPRPKDPFAELKSVL